MSQLREFANELPDNKRPFHGYLEKFLSGSWDFVTFLSQGYMKLTKEQFSKLESFFTPAQRAVLTPDMRSQKYKRRQSMKEEEEDQPGTPVGMQKRGPNAQSPTFIESQPAAKRMKTEPVPNYGSPRPPIRPQGVMPTSTPVRPSPLGMQSPINGPQFRPGMGGPVTGPRPPGQYAVRPPTQPGTPGVAYAFQPGPRPPAAGRPGQGRAAEGGIDDAFDASLNSGVDLQAEEKGLLRFGDDSGKMGDQHLRYSTPPQSEVEAKQLVKARMVEIARGSGSETALNVNDGAATAMAGCLDDLLRSLIEKMVVASKHRNGIYRQMLEEDSTREVQRTGSGVEFRYQKTTDVKAVIEDLRSKERTRELEERRKVAELQKDVEMQNSLDMAELAKKAKKKTLSVKRIEENLPAEIKARNQRNAIEKSIGSKKTYGWLEGGGKSDGLVPTAKAGGPPKPGPGITARELKQQQRLEQHAKKMARVVNVEDALLVLEKDRRFRLSKANMRWVAWRDAKLVAQPGPK
ncbi:transcription initiation factor TFIID component TAF4 family-domain-containing protein [Hyaloraphidium curvatum]|nr:transcription initiation factor TFIID component TAF4 family-domain-containing protein [Hyaloraphidium curvatum]